MKKLCLELRQSVAIAEWNESVKQRILLYWQEHEFVFSESEGDILRGRRGNMRGNMTSFNMRKLLATLTVSRPSTMEILCVLEVNTIWQIISPANQATLQTEVDTFASLFEEQQTLVRASLQPAQELQTVLLRAATGGQATPPKELLRPVAEQE